MPDDAITEEQMKEFFARNAPPRVPGEGLGPHCPELDEIGGWNRNFAASIVAGMLTMPQLDAHGVRIDWLQRLILSTAQGARKVRRRDLIRVLNVGLVKARVARLEDPIEDLFCELLVTGVGSFKILLGQWETAATHTRTVIEAFLLLPDDIRKRAALKTVVALLMLSDLLVDRAGAIPQSPTEGRPGAPIKLPSDASMRKAADRMHFSDRELVAAGLSPRNLEPFVLAEKHLPYLKSSAIGDSPLEFHPLLRTSTGFLVVSPANISIAVRAMLINTAKQGGLQKPFDAALMWCQERHTDLGHFWPVPHISLSAPNSFGIRASVLQYDEGRLLHVIQLPPLTGDFPRQSFDAIRELSDQAYGFLVSDIEKFWAFANDQPNCRTAATVVILGGWGSPYAFSPPIDESKVPGNWQYLAVSFADIGTLAAVKDGRFRDVSRIVEQESKLQADGFEFQNLNGFLNLFGFWQTTRGNLIPEHLLEIQPPSLIGIPTNELLKPRVRAAMVRDLRKLPMLDGTLKLVERLDRAEGETLQPIYASVSDIEAGTLLGSVLVKDCVWWVKSEAFPNEKREWRYRVWNAVLEWLDGVGIAIVERFPSSFPPSVGSVTITIPGGDAFGNIDIRSALVVPLANTIAAKTSMSGVSVTIDSAWLSYLYKPENDAEVELISAILASLSEQSGTPLQRNVIRGPIREAVGSSDWRQIHASEATRPDARLAAAGLTSSFKAIPYSAHCLAKCGSVWTFRDRTDGNEIDGIEDCKLFIVAYRDALLASLIATIRQFNREALCIACGRRYQDARVEIARWHLSIRALRAIRGGEADASAFEQFNESNGVQRAAKIIAEIAACEACADDGYEPSVAELDDLFAKALLIFGNSQLLSSIESELVPAKIRISPAGDLLTDRSVSREMVRPGAEWLSRRNLDEAADNYLDRSDGEENGKGELDGELRRAVEAEFGQTAEVIFNFQFDVVNLAAERKNGILVARRVELMELLAKRHGRPAAEFAAFLSRLTLPARAGWHSLGETLRPSDIDMGRFDRPWSLINRPLLALDQTDDPKVVVIPMMISDATMYCVSGLLDGALNNEFWISSMARQFAGSRGKLSGDRFEDELVAKLRNRGLHVIPRCKLSAVLNQKVPPELGDIDALAVSADRRRVWVIEAKNLRLCRTEAEAAARMAEYRGRIKTNRRGKNEPDKMLRHIRRVEYLRAKRERLHMRLDVVSNPNVLGLLIVNAPQPMNFKTDPGLQDSQSIYLGALDAFRF